MRRQIVTLACALLGPVAHAETEQGSDPAAASEAPATSVKCQLDIGADQGRAVFVQVMASPKLTAAARHALELRGILAVESRDQAEIVYEIDGAFQALRPATRRTAEVRLGDYAEQGAPLATKSGRGASVMLSLNPLAMLLGTLGSNVGNLSGAQDVVNTTAVGDPDGKCLVRCDGWRYKQRSVATLKRRELDKEQRCTAMSYADAQALDPERLFRSSLEALGTALGLGSAGLVSELRHSRDQ